MNDVVALANSARSTGPGGPGRLRLALAQWTSRRPAVGDLQLQPQ
jgi:hypothetical protein